MVRRRSIDVDGFSHGSNPTPAASRIGNILFTGGVFGVDPAGGSMPDDLEVQTRLVFFNLRRILEAGGASFDDVVKIEFYVKDLAAVRPLINREWSAAFPDPASRPARHVFHYELPGDMLVQCDAFAVIGG